MNETLKFKMANYKTNPTYTDDEFADILQCYLDSGKKIELTQKYYIERYPDRKEPKLTTVKEVVQNYLDTLESNETAISQTQTDWGIINYFKNNTHATVKKAASIFNVKACYVNKLIKEGKAQIEEQVNAEVNKREKSNCSRKNKKIKKNTKKSKQDWSDSDDELCNNINKEKDVDNNIKMEPPDVKILSEASDSRTDDDIEFYESRTRKKRKKKNCKGGYKKLKISGNSQKSSADILKVFQMRIPIVYTTRLEEMAILYNNIKHMNNACVLNDILLQSKPKYNGDTSNIKLTRTMNFNLLREILKKLQKSETLIDLTQKEVTKTTNANDNDDEDFIITSVLNRKELNTGEDAARSRESCNVIIIINNLFSNIRDIYMTDSKGDVIEYCCTDISDCMKNMDSSKFRWTFDICCWFHRQHKIESIWPRDKYPFTRYLTTTHKCPPDRCVCCCKPKENWTTEAIFKPTFILQQSDNLKKPLNIESNENQTSLISRALRYKKQKKNINTSYETKQYPKTSLNNKQNYNLTEIMNKGFGYRVCNEHIEISKNKEVFYYSLEINYSNMKVDYRGQNKIICCDWMRNDFFYEEYKQSNITSGTFRFLKKTSSPYKCDLCKTKSKKINSYTKSIIPNIEHSRTPVKPTLLKIGFIDNENVAQMKVTSKVESNNPLLCVKLNVRCNQVPNFLMEVHNVNLHVGTAIVKTFTLTSLTIGEDRKLIASMDTSFSSIIGGYFEIFKLILQNLQKHLPCIHTMTPGTPINIAVEINEDSCKCHMSRNQGLDVACNSKSTDPSNQSSKISYVDKQTSTEQTLKKINKKTVVSFDNAPNHNKANDVPSTQSSKSTCSVKKLGKTERNNPAEVQKPEVYNSFANYISLSKQYYMNSFKSYLSDIKDVDDDMSLPKISNVFSLQESASSDKLVSPTSSTVHNPKSMILEQSLTAPQQSKSNLVNPFTDSSIKVIPVHNQLNQTTLMTTGVDAQTDLGIFTPTNITMMPLKELPTTLPDIVNDVPINIPDTGYVVVKDEDNNEVVVLDSD